MNGFVREARRGLGIGCGVNPDAPLCSFGAAHPDVMGYHDAREIPNYWAYARNFVLQDHMFQPDTSWSLPAHLFMVSEWSARCRTHAASSCVNAIENPLAPPHEPQNPTGRKPIYAWTDLTYLLHKHHVSWRYFVVKGAQPDCDDGGMVCKPVEAERGHARDLEPAAVVRHGQGRPRAAQHRPDEAAVRDWRSAARCRRSRG